MKFSKIKIKYFDKNLKKKLFNCLLRISFKYFMHTLKIAFYYVNFNPIGFYN